LPFLNKEKLNVLKVQPAASIDRKYDFKPKQKIKCLNKEIKTGKKYRIITVRFHKDGEGGQRCDFCRSIEDENRFFFPEE